VHARKAWLKGLSPKQNRTVPPINYDFVYQLKQSLTKTPIVINGNINTSAEISDHLTQVDGVMLGRLACNQPYTIAEIHHALFPESPLRSRREILIDYLDYLQAMVFTDNAQLAANRVSLFLKPIYQLAHGLPEARRWKSYLAELEQRMRMKTQKYHIA
jgi:tRNA-dihydrouridine synthase A